MTIKDFLAQFTATTGDIKKELAAKDEKIAALSARLEKVEADDDADSSQLDDLLEQLREVLNEQATKDSDDSDADADSDSSDSDSDAAPADDSDADNDETDAKAATKTSKVKLVAQKTAKVIAEHKKLKASVPKKVISAIASMGIPAPVKTKVDGEKPALKGRARVAAAFTEQLANK